MRVDGGEVFVGGKPFWSNPQAAKRIMGVVPQELAIYEELTGRENLEFWGRMAGLSARDARARANLLTFLSRPWDPTASTVWGIRCFQTRRIC